MNENEEKRNAAQTRYAYIATYITSADRFYSENCTLAMLAVYCGL